MEITLTIPDEVAAGIQNGSKLPVSRKLLEMAALEGYKSGLLTLAQIQAMLGFESRFELDGFLKDHGVLFQYSPEEIEEELATIRTLREAREENGAQAATPFELVEDLLGVFDSSEPFERLKRERNAFGRGVVAKLEKQGIKLP